MEELVIRFFKIRNYPKDFINVNPDEPLKQEFTIMTTDIVTQDDIDRIESREDFVEWVHWNGKLINKGENNV